jgi:hypothetical protein
MVFWLGAISRIILSLLNESRFIMTRRNCRFQGHEPR